MNLNNYIKTVLSGVKTWALSTFANKRDFDDLNSRMYHSEQVEKFFFKNQQISPMDSYGDYVNMSFLEKQCDEIRVGDTLNVVWDGTKYECKVFYYDESLIIGNKSIVGTIMGESFVDTGEPFVIGIRNGYEVGFSYTDMVSESHVVSISGMVEKVHKIDEKYLPEMSAIGAEGIALNSEIFNDYLGNLAAGEYSHAEGSATNALGYRSHAEGYRTTAEGGNSHAEGSRTTASGSCAHAEGYRTTASNDSSHAEGDYTSAIGRWSHSEGSRTTASGDESHAEGGYTTASGACSHAEGYETIASGNDAHAEGNQTIASSDNQHVQGKFNIEDASSIYAHIVGNGPGSYARSNAHTLDWDGNAWFAGDVYVGSTSGTNKDDGSKKLATVEDLNDTKDSLVNELNAIKDAVVLKDSANGYNYIVQIKNGTLITYCACDHIELTAMPMKTEYVRGEAFDPTGMVIAAVMQDGSTNVIEGYSYTEYVMSDNIEIQYVEVGTAHTLSIPVTVTEFDPTVALVDFDYTANDDGTYTLTGWKGTYQGVTSTEMIIPDNSLIIL